MKRFIALIPTALLVLLSGGCNIKNDSPKEDKTSFAYGADVSWLPQMEAAGITFCDSDSKVKNCLQILSEKGINAVRLRVFVNPSTDPTSGHCSTGETVALALRAKKLGMKVMIDLHYSDTWADPGHQAKPTAWVNDDFMTLLDDLYTHTHKVMTALKEAGVSPEWVQVGNEITGGMLWPDGSTSDWPRLVKLINNGYNAVKTVSPSSKVILHIDQGNNNERSRYWFDNAKNYGAKFDVIGLSYYPYWLDGHPDYKLSIDDLGNNLTDLVSRYDKEIMIVETGGEVSAPENTRDMLAAVISRTRSVAERKGLGVFYWEPEGKKSWSGYSLCAWGEDGKPTKALDAFSSK